MVPASETFQPATIETGAHESGKHGYYTHKMPVSLVPGGSWQSPRICIVAGKSVYDAMRSYMKDSGILQYAPLNKTFRKSFPKTCAVADIEIGPVCERGYPDGVQLH